MQILLSVAYWIGVNKKWTDFEISNVKRIRYFFGYLYITIVNITAQAMYVTLGGVCAAMLFGGKGIIFTSTEGVFIALVIQQAIRAFVIMILQFAPLYSMFHNISQSARFTKYNLLNLKCVFWLSLHIYSGTFLILRRLDRDII